MTNNETASDIIEQANHLVEAAKALLSSAITVADECTVNSDLETLTSEYLDRASDCLQEVAIALNGDIEPWTGWDYYQTKPDLQQAIKASVEDNWPDINPVITEVTSLTFFEDCVHYEVKVLDDTTHYGTSITVGEHGLTAEMCTDGINAGLTFPTEE